MISDDNSTLLKLNYSGEHFRCGSTLTVNQHYQLSAKRVRSAGFGNQSLGVFSALQFADSYVMIKKTADNSQKSFFRSSAVATQVEHQGFMFARPIDHF